MKKKKLSVCAFILSGSLLFSSCIGSFTLWHKVLDWNQTIGNKFVNELVFIACNIVPIYPIAGLIDVVVLNSIEFWTGSNPATANVGKVKKVKGENGDYTIKTLADGYTISKDGKAMNLIYNKKANTWNVVYDGNSTKLLKMNNDGTAELFLPNGKEMNVTLDAQGVTAARQVAMSSDVFFADR
ncbi:DUF3332 domain-containing protein [uncultured Bacteroides sp.]|uniref:DUF3332 domain-containing protein n=1 Tax=uncultured Bacteroides sp. TaxID=162156 RepID=UPI002AA6B8FE|nr:DUF3332 domain-containing protein [uncultured Bacteroides sp.]